MSRIAKVDRRSGRAEIESCTAVRPIWTGWLAARPLRTLQRLLAGAALLAFGAPRGAHAQSVTVSAPTLGNVAAAASGPTIFRFTPGGAVGKQSGDGARVSTGSVEFQVTVTCTTGTCVTGNSTVTIASGTTTTGRADFMSNYNVALGTAVLAAGTTLPGPSSPYTFKIAKIGANKSATFTIGADIPIKGDDDTTDPVGAATSPITVTVNTTAKGSTLAANVLRSLSFSATGLEFGRIVRPSTGSNSIAIPATVNTRFISGTGNAVGLPTPTPARAKFTLLGAPSQTLTLTIPTSITLTDAASDTLTLSASNNAPSSPSLNASGTLTFYMGGGFTITNTTPTGAYVGSFTVTAVYN